MYVFRCVCACVCACHTSIYLSAALWYACLYKYSMHEETSLSCVCVANSGRVTLRQSEGTRALSCQGVFFCLLRAASSCFISLATAALYSLANTFSPSIKPSDVLVVVDRRLGVSNSFQIRGHTLSTLIPSRGALSLTPLPETSAVYILWSLKFVSRRRVVVRLYTLVSFRWGSEKQSIPVVTG